MDGQPGVDDSVMDAAGSRNRFEEGSAADGSAGEPFGDAFSVEAASSVLTPFADWYSDSHHFVDEKPFEHGSVELSSAAEHSLLTRDLADQDSGSEDSDDSPRTD